MLIKLAVSIRHPQIEPPAAIEIFLTGRWVACPVFQERLYLGGGIGGEALFDQSSGPGGPAY